MAAIPIGSLTQPIGLSLAIHTYRVYGEFLWKVCRQRKKAKHKLLHPACWTIKLRKSLISALGGGIAHHVYLSSNQSMENGLHYCKSSLQICFVRVGWNRNYSVIRLVGWSVFNTKPERKGHARLPHKGWEYSGGEKHWRFGKQKGSIFIEKFDEKSRKRSLRSDNPKFWFLVQIYTNQGDFRVVNARTLDETWHAGVLGVLRLNLEEFWVFPYRLFLYISPISNRVLRMKV